MIMMYFANYGVPASSVNCARQLWDIRAAMADYESGDDRGGAITPYVYSRLQQALEDCERIFGEVSIPNDERMAA